MGFVLENHCTWNYLRTSKKIVHDKNICFAIKAHFRPSYLLLIMKHAVIDSKGSYSDDVTLNMFCLWEMWEMCFFVT